MLQYIMIRNICKEVKLGTGVEASSVEVLVHIAAIQHCMSPTQLQETVTIKTVRLKLISSTLCCIE